MIVFIVIGIIIIIQIVLKIAKNKQIKVDNYNYNQEMTKLSILPNRKKINVLATIVSIVLSLVVLSLPITLNVCLYMMFPLKMIFGQVNMLFTFVLSYLCFILMNLIHHKIIKSYIYEYKEKHPEVEEESLPSINLKKVVLSDLCNVFISIFILVLLTALFFLI